MGASFQTVSLHVADAAALRAKYDDIVATCRYESGHGGYSGTFAEAPMLEVTSKRFTDVNAADDWLAENAVKWEAAKAVRVVPEGQDAYWLIGAWCSE